MSGIFDLIPDHVQTQVQDLAPYLAGISLVLTGLFMNPLNVPLPLFFQVHDRKKLRNRSKAYDPPSSLKSKKFLVLVNPNAGAGMGKLTYDEVIKPMLEKAKQSHDVVFTTGPGHASQVCREVAANPALESYDCIISASGDGMLHECLNGLLSNVSASSKGHNTRTAKRQLPPLAVVPVGSGNGVADSLYGRRCGPHVALEKIIAGKPSDIDVMAMTYVGKPELGLIYDLHFFCWAVFSDHDFLTENTLRWLGPMLKMVLAPAIVILRMTWYGGVLDFAPVEVAKDLKKHYKDPKSWPESPDDKTMRRVDDSFWCMAAGNLKEAGGDLSATPYVKQDEGAVDILMVTKSRGWVSRFRGLMVFLQAENGEHTEFDDIQIVKCNKFRLKPGKSRYRGSPGHLQLSGQEQENGEVEVEVRTGLARVMK
ncbi:hypothetical protein TrLO_g8627 [Triparma laevis f. longispina]|uniref:DAGKc domain-containing protein n=1 Tax=Triparma laevis f. longispina TaxID=1714387 RepID=A0A9W7AW44_9STRA|nr:hypothetical protein TrLO_g8627 [Triparma laevis f. longispina]